MLLVRERTFIVREDTTLVRSERAFIVRGHNVCKKKARVRVNHNERCLLALESRTPKVPPYRTSIDGLSLDERNRKVPQDMILLYIGLS